MLVAITIMFIVHNEPRFFMDLYTSFQDWYLSGWGAVKSIAAQILAVLVAAAVGIGILLSLMGGGSDKKKKMPRPFFGLCGVIGGLFVVFLLLTPKIVLGVMATIVVFIIAMITYVIVGAACDSKSAVGKNILWTIFWLLII